MAKLTPDQKIRFVAWLDREHAEAAAELRQLQRQRALKLAGTVVLFAAACWGLAIWVGWRVIWPVCS